MKNNNVSKISYIEKARKITSREYLMKLIYQIDILEGDLQDIDNYLENFLRDNEEYIINRYEELLLQFSNESSVNLENVNINDAIDFEYMRNVCNELSMHSYDIEELITKHALNWSLDRIAKVDLAILKLAICEVVYMSDEVPVKVSINEAVNLAKLYCDDKSPKFVNGILGSVVNDTKRK
ncbi:transcription antitermination factor NusB [Terrisporobacter sp.]